MTYAEALEDLFALGPELATGAGRRKFELAHMRTLCGALGDPQDQVPAMLIAGTNGKGSTAATLASILVAAGYRTGLYTSPHLERVNERIQLAHAVLPTEYGAAAVHGADGALRMTPIADGDFARLYTRMREAAGDLVERGELPMMPSFFERLTAVGFLYFAEAGAEIVVLEVGLGGRLDATNIVEPMVSVITDIALDHQEYLGDTIAGITAEKCGILREHGTLVTLPQHPEANQGIGLVATSLGVTAINAAVYLPRAERNSERLQTGIARNRYVLEGGLTVDSPLLGQHQQRNIALAIATAICLRNGTSYVSVQKRNSGGYEISDAAIEAGIRSTGWPGRLEFLTPHLLVDVAHNPAGAWTLRAALAELPEDRPRTLIFSCMRDKSLEEMSRILFPLFDSSADGDPMRRFDHLILAPMANDRAAAVEDLLASAQALGVPAHAAPHVEGALAQARRVTPKAGLIVASGSVFLVGEIRRLAEDQV